MGCNSSNTAMEPSTTNASSNSEEVKTFTLQHPGSCTGMFWRKDPRPVNDNVAQKGNAEWPKNGAVLQGKVHDVSGVKWLDVSSWKQAKSEHWIPNCTGLWMEFEQGGKVLHAK